MDALPFHKKGNYPASEMLSKNGIMLPCGTKLEEEDIKIISDEIMRIMEEK